MRGSLNVSCKTHLYAKKNQCQWPTGMVKKVVQQGRSHFDARSILPVDEHGKKARTPLAAFFNIPIRVRDQRPELSS